MDRNRAKSSGQNLRCTIHPLNSLGDYIYVVICSFYQGQIILSRQKNKQTWETQGGHIEANETPDEAARRELYEESGIRSAEIIPVCDYYGYDSDSHANGMVFAALVEDIGDLPDSEMAEIRFFDQLPQELSYPMVTPILFEACRKAVQDSQQPDILQLQTIPYELTICKVASLDQVDLSAEFYFLGKTDEEISLVCRREDVPAGTLVRDDGWRGFRIVGVLEFSLVGILSQIAAALAEAEISVFAVSTYNTDYVLVKEEKFEEALEVLRKEGYEVVG